MKNTFTRRDFLNKLKISGYALTAGAFINACSPVISSAQISADISPDVELSLTAASDRVPILSGNLTDVWHYRGELFKGPTNTLQAIPGSYLGPVIRLVKGQYVRIHFRNQLNEPSIIHWHGLHVPESADGHPRLAIDPGEEYIYEFEVMDRAGTYWFHPHPHGRTGPQVYKGLAGLLIISDGETTKLGLPEGNYDIPIVIQDRTFSDNSQLVYSGTNMMGQMVGFLGDTILINGQPNFILSVENRPYRLRLLNGSNARIYKLAWSDNSPFTIIGTDGGLLERPLKKTYVTLAPAQRLDLWVDFSHMAIGSSVQLINIPNDTPGGQAEFSLLSINVDWQAESTAQLPEKLSTLNLNNAENAINFTSPRDFSLSMGMGMSWNINGRTFEMEKVARDEKIHLGDLEIWQFTNKGGRGMGMILPHPMHIHGLQFQIIDRKIESAQRDAWETISDGFVDEGWHDTVLVMPGEQVRVLMKFEDFEGLYLYHCHNLEHEDMGMMRNYRVSR